MYKIFKVMYSSIIYNEGESPYFYYIGRDKDDVIANSKMYKQFADIKNTLGGYIYITEMKDTIVKCSAYNLINSYDFENIDDFSVSIVIDKKD